mgnify:CR=1 FL=1
MAKLSLADDESSKKDTESSSVLTADPSLKDSERFIRPEEVEKSASETKSATKVSENAGAIFVNSMNGIAHV